MIHSGLDLEGQALVHRGRRAAGLVLALVVALTVVAALVPMRFVGHIWSEDDLFQCEASAFVSEAGSHGVNAKTDALSECRAHRRNQRWGPWGVFGNANDGSKYTAADD